EQEGYADVARAICATGLRSASPVSGPLGRYRQHGHFTGQPVVCGCDHLTIRSGIWPCRRSAGAWATRPMWRRDEMKLHALPAAATALAMLLGSAALAEPS